MRPSTLLHGGLALLLPLSLTVGCSELRTPVVPAAAPAKVPMGMVLVVSDTGAATGTEVRVAMRLAPGDTTHRVVGSYTARLTFDPARYEYLGDVERSSTGAIAAVNATDGQLRVAGASATGYPDGLLVELRFRVRGARGAEALRLDIDELHDVAHADLRSTAEPLRAEVLDARVFTARAGAP